MTEYGTVAGFKIYHNVRANEISGHSDAAIDAAKLIASEWIDSRYRLAFPGTKVGFRNQTREWPRLGACDIHQYPIAFESVPTEVENATYEAALKHLVEPGSLSVDFTPSQYRRAAVDGAINVEYFGHTNAVEVQTRFQIIDETLAPILTGTGLGAPLSGPSFRA